MPRRTSNSSRFGGAALALLVLTGTFALVRIDAKAQPPSGAPNVLIIVTDDQRYDGTLAGMPGVRKWFKKQGRFFSQAFATTPLCCPARASIFTGQYAHNHGVRKNNLGDELPQNRTIQRSLWLNGYNTAMAGKYLNGWQIEDNPPYFDRWAMQKWGYYESEFNVDGFVQEVSKYSTTYVTDNAIEFLEDFEAEDPLPWFVYVAPFAAHKPYAPQERYAERDVGKWYGNPAVRERNLHDKPEIKARDLSPREGHFIRRKQLRTLYSADDSVGRIMSWLEENGESENTLAFFISDNGRSWGEHGLDGKRLPYTESVRVPFMLRWPRRVEGATRDKRIVANIDLAPTILEAAGISPEHRLDGIDLLDRRQERSRILLESWGNFRKGIPSWASTRTGDYQYVEYYGRRGRRIFREYYLLDRDPWQLKNLFGNSERRDDPVGPPLNEQLRRDRRCAGRSCP